MPMKNPGSAPDRNIEWRKCPCFHCFLIVCSHSSRQGPGRFGSERGAESVCSLRAFALRRALTRHLWIDLSICFQALIGDEIWAWRWKLIAAPRLGCRIGSSSSAWVTDTILYPKRKEQEAFDPCWQMIDWQFDLGRIQYCWSLQFAHLYLFEVGWEGGSYDAQGNWIIENRSQGYCKNFCSWQLKEVYETFRLCLRVLLFGFGGFFLGVHSSTLSVLRRGFSEQSSHTVSKGSSRYGRF